MNLKLCLLTLFAFVAFTSYAQDKIYKTDGDIVDSKVKEVNQTTVVYKRFDNQGGPEYTILRKDIVKIVYENGSIDNFRGSEPVRSKHSSGKVHPGKNTPTYGDNLLTIIPAAYLKEIVYNSVNDPGIGICYERMLDTRGHISVVMPVMINFTQNKDFSSDFFNSYNPGISSYNPPMSHYVSYLFMPGIKLYPAENNRFFRYGIGGSFFAMFGKEPYYLYNENNTTVLPAPDWRYSLYGMAVTNSFCFSPTKHFYMEFDANAAVLFQDNRRSDYSAVDDLGIPMMQFILKAGYRF